MPRCSREGRRPVARTNMAKPLDGARRDDRELVVRAAERDWMQEPAANVGARGGTELHLCENPQPFTHCLTHFCLCNSDRRLVPWL